MVKLRIYGAGGFGINILKKAAGIKSSKLCADLNPVYVDTSTSNVREGFEKDDVFVLKQVDGSGKVRAENATEIERAIDELLITHEPGDFNIIVSSGSGGSGSVIAPLLASELLSRNIPVIVMMLGTVESTIAADNTMKTMKTYANICKKREVPINLYYHLQEPGDKEHTANDNFISVISSLAILSSQCNDDLDKRDLHNFVFYPNVTKTKPTLLAFDVALRSEVEEYAELIENNIISLIDLLPSRDLPITVCNPFYRAVGYAPVDEPLTYFTSPDPIHRFADALDTYGREAQALLESTTKPSRLLGDDDDSDDNGMCL